MYRSSHYGGKLSDRPWRGAAHTTNLPPLPLTNAKPPIPHSASPSQTQTPNPKPIPSTPKPPPPSPSRAAQSKQSLPRPPHVPVTRERPPQIQLPGGLEFTAPSHASQRRVTSTAALPRRPSWLCPSGPVRPGSRLHLSPPHPTSSICSRIRIRRPAP
ncbi:hypothetical protein AOQ84DRAFT_133613 [Glonium stellatum]|uniref:Uncharacterized protein n=1 Tax=Glonium stellatum TaxID=574774 RepID=A0A8E2ES51_9PEZI|nr:hypothetical protein AOQ84DRAFT_133613 [Glonium stellatum]